MLEGVVLHVNEKRDGDEDVSPLFHPFHRHPHLLHHSCTLLLTASQPTLTRCNFRCIWNREKSLQKDAANPASTALIPRLPQQNQGFSPILLMNAA
jgi:hypothetical protein